MSILYDMMRPRVIQTLAILLAISYIGVASRRWRPAMLFDAAMLCLVMARPYPALLAFACFLICVRWIGVWANWVALSLKLDTFGGHTLALARFLLPACDVLMSSAGVVLGGIGRGDMGTVSAYQNTVLADTAAENTSTRIPVSGPSSRSELIDILARLQADGKYVLSANKIADLFVGSPYAVSRNVILDEVAAIRNPMPIGKPTATMQRPRGGW